MPMAKRAIKSGPITTEEYYNEKFLRIEVEIKHLYEIIKLGFAETNRRFEDFNNRFDHLTAETNRRFDESNKRFEQMSNDFNSRFDAMTKRMDNFMIWSFGITLTCTGLIIAAMKFWK